MKYSGSPSLDSPSMSLSDTRYEPSLAITMSAVTTVSVPLIGSAVPSASVSRAPVTGLSAVTTTLTLVPAGA